MKKMRCLTTMESKTGGARWVPSLSMLLEDWPRLPPQGMTGKPLGRVGDTPLIGAGTWADQRIAVSCTGIGEAFIRTAAAHQTAVLHREMKIEQAALAVLDEVEPFGGRGGMIAVDREGNVTLPFQTMLMYRGMYCDGSVRLGIGPELMD